MNIRAQLEKKIEGQEREIEGLRAEISRRESFLAGLKEALKLLPRADQESVAQSLRPGSDLAKVQDLLRKTGHPLHIGEILKGIGKEVNKSNRASLSGSLGTYVRKREIFLKSAPNTFGLIDQNAKADEDWGEEEPPDDFGLDQAKVMEH